MKITKSSRRASTNTSPTRPNLLTNVTAEDADPIPTTQLDHDFIDEADAFQGMITLGEGDMSAKLTDPSAHAVTCRTLYAKTRAELHIIYRHIYSLRSTTGDTSVIDRAPEERILHSPGI